MRILILIGKKFQVSDPAGTGSATLPSNVTEEIELNLASY